MDDLGHPQMRAHPDTLNAVSRALDDADFISKLPNGNKDFEDILKAVKNPLDSGTASKFVPLPEHLDNIRDLFSRHSETIGRSELEKFENRYCLSRNYF